MLDSTIGQWKHKGNAVVQMGQNNESFKASKSPQPRRGGIVNSAEMLIFYDIATFSDVLVNFPYADISSCFFSL